MNEPTIYEFVCLTRNIPGLGLVVGQLGEVKSKWCGQNGALEVEFQSDSGSFPTRALLLRDAIRVVDEHPNPV